MSYDDGLRVPLDLSAQAPYPAFKFWGASSFFNVLLDQRMLFSRGRVRGGKTLLCTAIAYEFVRLRYVDRLWTNYRARYACPVVPPLRSGVFVLDEAAEFLDARNFATNNVKGYTRYLGKLGLWLLLPSVQSVDVRLRALTVERKWAFGKWWVYEWFLESGSSRDRGRFVLVNPQSLFPCYGTKDFTREITPDAGFADALDVTIELERRTTRSWNGLDFYLPWWNSDTASYNVESTPYTDVLADAAREVRYKKQKKEASSESAAAASVIMSEVTSGKFTPSYPA